MDNKSRKPIIFIPGLMGSMGKEMIPGTGSWGFGVARWIYAPFIENLEKQGYKKDVDLFICYYDWRKNCCDIVQQYLLPLLIRVREIHPWEKIDCICHSMGGLVARTYIQGIYYEQDIERLIMIGTPNKGAAEAYYLWNAGKLMDNKSARRGLHGLLGKGYIWLLKKLLKIPFGEENLVELHRQFPAIQDLLPSFDYDPILVYEERGQWMGLPRGYRLYTNPTLDRLNYNLFLLRERTEAVYCIIGQDFSTTQYLVMDREEYERSRKEKIVHHISTPRGDGTVICESAGIEGAERFYIDANHHDIVKGALPLLYEIYGFEPILQDKSLEEHRGETMLHILCTPHVELWIEREGKEMLSFKDGKVHYSHEYICETFDNKFTWIILKNIPIGQYRAVCKSYGRPEVDLLLLGEKLEKEMDCEKEAVLVQSNSYTYHIEFDISTFS